MASTSKFNLRGTKNIFLVGNSSNQIVGSKLQSIKQTLKVFFFFFKYTLSEYQFTRKWQTGHLIISLTSYKCVCIS